MILPVPTFWPPQVPLYQTQEFPAAKFPPWTESVKFWPGQICVAEGIIAVGSVELWLTVTDTLTQDPWEQVLSILAKYCVEVVGDTDKVDPVPIEAPDPQPPSYQTYCAPAPREPPCILKVVDAEAHKVDAEALAPVGSVEAFSTVTVTVFEFKSPQESVFKTLLKQEVWAIPNKGS